MGELPGFKEAIGAAYPDVQDPGAQLRAIRAKCQVRQAYAHRCVQALWNFFLIPRTTESVKKSL